MVGLLDLRGLTVLLIIFCYTARFIGEERDDTFGKKVGLDPTFFPTLFLEIHTDRKKICVCISDLHRHTL